MGEAPNYSYSKITRILAGVVQTFSPAVGTLIYGLYVMPFIKYSLTTPPEAEISLEITVAVADPFRTSSTSL
jgi:dihydroxyacetone kinase